VWALVGFRCLYEFRHFQQLVVWALWFVCLAFIIWLISRQALGENIGTMTAMAVGTPLRGVELRNR